MKCAAQDCRGKGVRAVSVQPFGLDNLVTVRLCERHLSAFEMNIQAGAYSIGYPTRPLPHPEDNESLYRWLTEPMMRSMVEDEEPVV